MQVRLILSLGALLGLFVPLAGAQTDECTYGVQAGGSLPMMFSSDHPFSGTVVTRFEQKLADGTGISGMTRTHLARDSKGRIYSEFGYCQRDSNGQAVLARNARVYDPATRISMNWSTAPGSAEIVSIQHDPEPQSLKGIPVVQPGFKPWRTPPSETTHEDLGTQTIAGVTAWGRRTTRIIPAGSEGNSQPITVVNESWEDRDLHQTVRTVRDDPRRGRTVSEFETMTPGEPDPAIFQPPANYAVREETISTTVTKPAAQ